MTKALASIRAALLCEDIRYEYNGTLILIGVWGPYAMIGEFPVHRKMHLLLLGDFEGDEPVELSFRLVKEDGQIIGGASGLAGGEKGTIGAPLPYGPFSLDLAGPETLALETQDPQGDWVLVQNWHFLEGDPNEAPVHPSESVGANQKKNATP